ncbi:SDR family oxidoreductase [Ramlibacter sp. RBP-2]|uniref:SDR family oxidoreductase n=1 Tax=Ramlibacter lithotrophicus TaxID=2606681 RepID=A0A7X6I6M2_9BURK|nr:SDR family oxidoreductase [Ramlibacter lithotrophicus]NKE66581.1 SDR family oxidoreductase [Ramlibacter lithotrophicus]
MSEPPRPRTALVTGSARRLGRDVALALAAAGWQVAIHYRGSAVQAEETVADCRRLAPGLWFEAFQADLADELQARELLPRVAARCGSVHAVVNNASVFEHDDAQSFGYDCLVRHLATNTAAPVVLAQALHRHVQGRSGDGVVVNLLDQKLWNQNPDFLSYTLSKAALEAANTALAMALAPLVRVVGVAPGLTLTSHMLTQEKFEQLHRMAPLGRSSTPADVAHAVRFALENQAITGTTLLVDGGQHLMKQDRDFSVM